MKKIFAIALAVVMVFAISATAFAAVGFPAVAAPAAGYSIDVVGLEETSGYFQTNTSTYLKYDQTKGVVAGSDLTYMVTLTLARSAANANLQNKVLYVWTENVKLGTAGSSAIGYGTTATGIAPLAAAANANGWDLTDFTAAGWKLDGSMPALTANDRDMFVEIDPAAAVSSGVSSQTLYILFQGTKVDTTANAVIHAEFDNRNWYSSGLSNTASYSDLWITKSGSDYHVERYMPAQYGAGNIVGYKVTIPAGTYAGVSVTFEGVAADTFNRNYQCTSVYVDSTNAAATVAAAFPNPAVYIVGINNLVVDFARIAAPSVFLGTANPNYAGLKGALDTVLGIFGFSFDELKLLNNAGFAAYAGSATGANASWTYYAYTTALTVSGPTAVPDTGDMSFLGFALIAIAAILGTAVVIKKVRA